MIKLDEEKSNEGKSVHPVVDIKNIEIIDEEEENRLLKEKNKKEIDKLKEKIKKLFEEKEKAENELIKIKEKEIEDSIRKTTSNDPHTKIFRALFLLKGSGTKTIDFTTLINNVVDGNAKKKVEDIYEKFKKNNGSKEICILL